MRLKKALPLIIFASTLLLIMVLSKRFLAYSHGARILDMRLGYTSKTVYDIFNNLSTEGILFYKNLLYIDFLFTISFIFIQNNLLKRVMTETMLNTKWRITLAITYVRCVFDILENISIITLLNSYPTRLPNLVMLSNIFTLLKFVMIMLWIIAILVILYARKKTIKNHTSEVI